MNQHLKTVSVKKPETGKMICEDASKRWSWWGRRLCRQVGTTPCGHLPETAIGTFQEFAIRHPPDLAALDDYSLARLV